MTRSPFVFLRTFLIFMLASTLPATGRTAACEPEVRPLALRLVNEARADPETLDHAMREAGLIWATAGVRLIWTGADGADRVAAFVIVRRRLDRSDGRGPTASRPGRSVMGRILIDEEDRPTRLIHVSLDGTTNTVLRSQHPLLPSAHRPLTLLQPIVGRALGRVIAHEIGHWLRGRGHAPEGLMKPVLSPHDLVIHEPPALPAAWRSTATVCLAPACGRGLTRHAEPAIASSKRVASEALRCVR